MNIKNITNPIRKIEKYLGSKLIENDVEIVDDVIEVWNVDGKTMPTAEQLNSFDAEVLADIQAEQDAETQKDTDKNSGKQKLIDLGLTEDEVNIIYGNN
tara:strand:- start:4788 stop:5084 length:297 start_codon:yes stop_codon:yes gene_type:complete